MILALEILLKDCWTVKLGKICTFSKILSKDFWSSWSDIWIFTKL